MISHISALVLTIQTIALLEIKYKMIICLFVSAGCVLPEIYSLRNKSSAHFIFASISTKQKYLEKKIFFIFTQTQSVDWVKQSITNPCGKCMTLYVSLCYYGLQCIIFGDMFQCYRWCFVLYPGIIGQAVCAPFTAESPLWRNNFFFHRYLSDR